MTKKIEDFPLILDAKNIADTLGISLRGAYYLMDDTSFPLLKLGRCKRVNRDDFFNWLEQQTLHKS